MQKNKGSKKIKQPYLNISPYNDLALDDRFTACVGINGDYDQNTICDGFNNAVRILIDSLKTSNETADTLVYPILFCFRHALELYLKDVYHSVKFIYNAKTHRDIFVKLQKMYRIKFRILQQIEMCKELSSLDNTLSCKGIVNKRINILNKRLKMINKEIKSSEECYVQEDRGIYTHDLCILKEKILKIYKIDERIPEVFDSVLQYLSPYEKIDPHGDAFRYLGDHKGHHHFKKKNIELVNLSTVAEHHKELSGLLDKVQITLGYLQEEYCTGTFTSFLSRKQLENISKILPKPDEYDDKIQESREFIKKQYNLGSDGFEEALEIIRKHREFSCNMGKEIVFDHLSQSTLEKLSECAKGRLDWNLVGDDISINELCLLWTFSEISGWKYGENNQYYSENLYALYRSAKFNRRITLYDICPKRDIGHIITGMKKCGQKKYADILSEYTKM